MFIIKRSDKKIFEGKVLEKQFQRPRKTYVVPSEYYPFLGWWEQTDPAYGVIMLQKTKKKLFGLVKIVSEHWLKIPVDKYEKLRVGEYYKAEHEDIYSLMGIACSIPEPQS